MFFYKGEKIELRKLEEEDCMVLYEEQKDSDAERGFELGIQNLEYEEVFLWLKKRKYMFAIQDMEKNFVGTIHIDESDERHGTFEYGIRILDKYKCKGFAKEAVMILFRLCFFELRYQKVNSPVVSFNEGSIKLHKSLGFVEEGRLRRTVYTDGKYYDQILFGMTKEEFEEIDKKNE